MSIMDITKASEITQFTQDLIEKHRVEIGERPQTTPVTWKGIGMTVKEAKFMIQSLEELKRECQDRMNGAQMGGEITTVATNGAGLVAIVAGLGLLFFPPTMLAGVVTLASGAGTIGVGKVVGDGVQKIGTNSNTQAIQQLDVYIDSIKNAIIASI
jgi:hypothetical protein